MKKMLQQLRRITKYAMMGSAVQCLVAGIGWAADYAPRQPNKDLTSHSSSLADRKMEEAYGRLDEKQKELSVLSVHAASMYSLALKGSMAVLEDSYRPDEMTLLIQNTPPASQVVTGKVVSSENKQGIPGVNVVLKNTGQGTVTDAEGKYSVKVPSNESVLVFSSIGFVSEEVLVGNQTVINLTLYQDIKALSEVVVVGYGNQKKESVVGAITQTSGKVLERAGVTNVGAALTGNVPGVTTIQGTGAPGAEDPQIFIRGQGTWNSSGPLILVDGIERSMSGLDISSVQSISVLKDASATAVFGVKGANGVILITTKRGVEGKANINVTLNSTVKMPSRLPEKYDSYDALRIRNLAIERELALSPSSWESYTPLAIMEKYRNPLNQQEAERYPNIDWVDETVRKAAMSYNGNINVSGGSSFVKYYTAVDFLHEGDVMKTWDNHKGYKPGYGYDRLNIRTNLDFKLTGTTTLSANLAALNGSKQDTWTGFEYRLWQAAYSLAPDVMYPQYSDGSFGYFPADQISNINSAQVLSNSGARRLKTTQLNTDFTLSQDLGMLVKGLRAKGIFSLDNRFVSQGGLVDGEDNTMTKWISPEGKVIWRNSKIDRTEYDYAVRPWTVRTDEMQNGETRRKMFYQLQANYGTQIGRHNITAMALFNRDQYATGSEFPNYREDWVFRTTYDFANKYFLEFNGSYNGSEKFSNEYRFQFFPSAAAGWMLSDEAFMKKFSWLDMFKFRASYGLVGNDNLPGRRWLYQTQWSYGQATHLGDGGYNNSPYNWYRESTIGNPDIHWEKVAKANVGFDYSLFKGLIEGNVDVFNDYRTDILLEGTRRATPDYFGGVPPTANLGKVRVKGYEAEVRLNYRFGNGIRLWANANMTHAKDRILNADDPELLDPYLKQQDFQIGQYRSHISNGYYNTWDEVYASSQVNAYDKEKLPGNFNLVDFNADGIINDFDNVPYAYPERPQNNYNATLGMEYKGFSGSVQFYGVNNVTRNVTQTNFSNGMNVVYQQGDYWTKDNTDAQSYLPRWATHVYSYGNFYNYDGSYVRLKTAELAYTFQNAWVNKAGIRSLRVYVNGNNLVLWTKMPDDRESNLGGWGGQGAYPTVKRYSLGLNIVL